MLSVLIAIEILSRLSQMLSVLLPQPNVSGSAAFMMTFTVRLIGLPFCLLSEHVSSDGDKPAPALLSCATAVYLSGCSPTLLPSSVQEGGHGRAGEKGVCLTPSRAPLPNELNPMRMGPS
jgi:hypothetical protein